MSEKLTTNTETENPGKSSGAEWQDLGSEVPFQGSNNRKLEQFMEQQDYVKSQVKSETYSQGLQQGNNAQKATELVQRAKVLKALHDHEGVNKAADDLDKLENEKINPQGTERMNKGGVENAKATFEDVTEIMAENRFTAEEFAKTVVTREESARIVIHETGRRNLLLKQIDIVKKQHPKGIFGKMNNKRKLDELKKELQRYGGEDHQKVDDIYSSASGRLNNIEAVQYGKDRAENFKMLESLTEKGKFKKDIKKKLKEKGFKSLPNSWNDANFTSHEMSLMSHIAESVLRSERYKEK